MPPAEVICLLRRNRETLEKHNKLLDFRCLDHHPNREPLIKKGIDSQDLLDDNNDGAELSFEQIVQPTNAGDIGSTGENVDWALKYQQLKDRFENTSEQLKKWKKKYAKLEVAKLSTDDYALRIGKDLQDLKDQQKIPQAKFTEDDGIAMTVHEIEELNGRSTSDSMFVGLLATHLVGADKLKNMSVTGQPCHRYAKLKKPDGSPLYPAAEKLDPQILDFICNKVAERVALTVGPTKVKLIRKQSEMVVIKRYIAQKIANLKKAAITRKAVLNIRTE
ncbi:uncharacterized protein LOC134207142 [Armigeres subalbatus]|uniref:uncharacterized protein LOC134207142 n=1 Tax=Armigeres subalbatus TaxID=124917 RepID=UPI002ED56909